MGLAVPWASVHDELAARRQPIERQRLEGGDLALRNAIRDPYHLDTLPTEQEVLDIAEKWRPYRSLATSYLFASAYERDQEEA